MPAIIWSSFIELLFSTEQAATFDAQDVDVTAIVVPKKFVLLVLPDCFYYTLYSFRFNIFRLFCNLL
jgi:hypothetical protein